VPTTLPAAVGRVAVDDAVAVRADALARIDVLANDSEPGGTLVPRSVTIVDPPAHGRAAPDKDGRVRYKPAAQYRGPDSFVYSVCDTTHRCFTAVVTLSVG
jgi:large repetitive protein